MAAISFRGSITRPLYRQVMARSSRPIRWIATTWVVAALIGLLGRTPNTPVATNAMLLMLVVGLLIIASPWISAWRVFSTDRLAGDELTGEADDHGVRIASAHGTADLPWSTAYRVVVGKDIVLLYQSAQLMRVFARGFFADEASWQAFRALATASVPRRARKGQRVMVIVLIWIAIIVLVVLFANSRP